MQRLSFGVAALVAVVFIVASATINSLFLSSLGRSELESGLFVVVSIASDVAKAVLPVIMARAVATRAWVHAAVTGVFLTVTIALSLASGIGFASTTRGSVTALRDAQAQRLARAETDLAGIDRRMATLTSVRSAAVIEEAIKAQLIDRRWKASEQCADPSWASARKFCAELFRLRGELAAAKEVAKLDTQRQALRAEIETLRGHGAGAASDPQADAVAELLGIAPRTVRLGLMIVIAVVLELGSVSLVLLAAGPAVRSAEKRERQEPAKAGAIQESRQVEGVKPARVPVMADRAYWLRERQKTKA